jgi:anti-sigma B factor antagonist
MSGIEFKLEDGKNGVTTVSIKGEIDMRSSPKVREQLTALFKKNLKAVIVDLSGVEYIDSSGIATLVEGLQWSHSSKSKFRLAGMTAGVKDVFEIARLLPIFEIFATKEEASQGV